MTPRLLTALTFATMPLGPVRAVTRPPATVHYDVALDQDGAAVDDITCPLTWRVNAKEGTHASHF